VQNCKCNITNKFNNKEGTAICQLFIYSPISAHSSPKDCGQIWLKKFMDGLTIVWPTWKRLDFEEKGRLLWEGPHTGQILLYVCPILWLTAKIWHINKWSSGEVFWGLTVTLTRWLLQLLAVVKDMHSLLSALPVTTVTHDWNYSKCSKNTKFLKIFQIL